MARSLDILRQRLASQRLAGRRFRRPEEVAAWFGAVQAQDYLGALWALGLRTRGATEASIEAAETRRALVRTWPLRGTLHFVAAADARWITRLAAPRILARNLARWERDFGVTPKLLARADVILTRALEGGRRLSRERLYEALEAKQIRTGASRGLHLLMVLALRGRLCLAGRDGKQQTFALLDEWIPATGSRQLEGDEALAELARRYFSSHGPATLRDFMWWSGATAKQAAAALANVASDLICADVDGVRHWWREPDGSARGNSARVQLLPAFDEYTVAYHDRSLLTDPAERVSKMGLLKPAVLIDGRVAGTWKRTLRGAAVSIAAQLHRRATREHHVALRAAAEGYAAFLGLELAALQVRPPPVA